jgi:hypothetical protein
MNIRGNACAARRQARGCVLLLAGAATTERTKDKAIVPMTVLMSTDTASKVGEQPACERVCAVAGAFVVDRTTQMLGCWRQTNGSDGRACQNSI